MSHVLTWRWQDLWPIQQPDIRGQSRHVVHLYIQQHRNLGSTLLFRNSVNFISLSLKSIRLHHPSSLERGCSGSCLLILLPDMFSFPVDFPLDVPCPPHLDPHMFKTVHVLFCKFFLSSYFNFNITDSLPPSLSVVVYPPSARPLLANAPISRPLSILHKSSRLTLNAHAHTHTLTSIRHLHTTFIFFSLSPEAYCRCLSAPGVWACDRGN